MKGPIAQVIGRVTPPPGVSNYPDLGIIFLITNLIRLAIIAAGIYSVFNLIIAGYGFMSAGGDTKKITDAWSRIWQTLLGLIVIAGAFVIAAILGLILFGNAGALLQLRIYGPPPP